MKKYLLYVPFVLVVIAGVIIYNFNYGTKTKYNMVTIDINPSVGLMIDENDEVVEVLALNDDAAIMVEDLDLVGLDVEEATTTVVDEAVEMGYIDEMSSENVIDVTTYVEDEVVNTGLNERLRTHIEEHLGDRSVNALVVANGLDEELKEKADLNDVSYGKMLLVDRAMQLDPTLDEKALLDMSIREIQAKIKEKAKEVRNQIREYYDENKDEIKAKKDEIIESSKERVEATKKAILEKVEDYNSLTKEEKDLIIEEKKAEIKESLTDVKERIQSGTKETIDSIREIIRNKRGN